MHLSDNTLHYIHRSAHASADVAATVDDNDNNMFGLLLLEEEVKEVRLVFFREPPPTGLFESATFSTVPLALLAEVVQHRENSSGRLMGFFPNEDEVAKYKKHSF
ncbi:hypothetical protein Fot_15911 [Forsythia ovata]|uniref:Uncharacterized protein n=1 Tax=Forsythia ovata TaxID=205694 RepID=A0ABD1WD73_9LAMI